jgi:photosystem II stability/assembly factor-like uncharacterized protein
MKIKLLISFLLFLSISACSGPQATVNPTAPAGKKEQLPETWTPDPNLSLEISKTPELTSTQPFPSATSSIEPTDLPQFPSPTPFQTVTLDPLIRGKEITINSLQMSSKSTGWALGQQDDDFERVLYTQDGGKRWEDRTPDLTRVGVNSSSQNITAYFYDEDIAWVILPDLRSDPSQSEHIIWFTIDAGETWEASAPLPVRAVEPYIFPQKFEFINPDEGWLWVHLGYEHMHDRTYLFQTRDGGKTWERLIDPEDDSLQALHNSGLAFADSNLGWMTKDPLGGFDPFLEQTVDGGSSWQRINIPPPVEGEWEELPLYCILENPTFSSKQTGFFLLQCAELNQDSGNFDWDFKTTYLYATTDRGENWLIQKFSTPVHQLLFLDYQIGLAFGEQHYHSKDGGASWNKFKEVTWLGEFNFINQQEGWAVARKGDTTALVHTVDGGLTYQQIDPTAR